MRTEGAVRSDRSFNWPERGKFPGVDGAGGTALHGPSLYRRWQPRPARSFWRAPSPQVTREERDDLADAVLPGPRVAAGGGAAPAGRVGVDAVGAEELRPV